MTYEVVIKPEHCIYNYLDNFCPLWMAVNLQFPELIIKKVLGSIMFDVDSKPYFFDSSQKNGWNSSRWNQLRSGKIKSFRLTISEK